MAGNRDIYKEFTEDDWKLFRSKIATWQENYMDKLNNEYIEILTQDKNPDDKFWELDKRIKKDRKKPGVIIELRRSTMVFNIIDLLNDKVIEMEDLSEFSDRFKEVISIYLKHFN